MAIEFVVIAESDADHRAGIEYDNEHRSLSTSTNQEPMKHQNLECNCAAAVRFLVEISRQPPPPADPGFVLKEPSCPTRPLHVQLSLLRRVVLLSTDRFVHMLLPAWLLTLSLSRYSVLKFRPPLW